MLIFKWLRLVGAANNAAAEATSVGSPFRSGSSAFVLGAQAAGVEADQQPASPLLSPTAPLPAESLLTPRTPDAAAGGLPTTELPVQRSASKCLDSSHTLDVAGSDRDGASTYAATALADTPTRAVEAHRDSEDSSGSIKSDCAVDWRLVASQAQGSAHDLSSIPSCSGTVARLRAIYENSRLLLCLQLLPITYQFLNQGTGMSLLAYFMLLIPAWKGSFSWSPWQM